MAPVLSTDDLRGQLLLLEPLANYTSWRVGGKADQLYIPADLKDLQVFLKQLDPNEPLLWLGLGSNTLIRDGGFRGTVIVTQGALKEMNQLDELHVMAEAGVSCATLARFTARQGLAGVEFLAGIPGTVGGALAMNAGCHGGETWPRVERVTLIDRYGNLHERKPGDFQVSYREVIRAPDQWFVSAVFALTPCEPQVGKDLIKTLLAHRANTQPINLPSGGSVFRNPPGDHAGRLIEAAGLKGLRMGGAMISPKHANFIVATETASAEDIEMLIDFIEEQVFHSFGIRLQAEVHRIGEHKKTTVVC